jgi:hypothetical protein
MLTQPQGVSMVFGTTIYPVPRAEWNMFSTLAQAQQVLALAQKNFPAIQFQMVDGAMEGDDIFFILPYPNPLGIAVWLIQATVPGPNNTTLTLNDFAGDVWNRGPVGLGYGGIPDGLDTNGAYGGIGGSNLIYFNAGSSLAEFKWSETAGAEL